MRKSPSDRGAILVHVAFALLALMALASFMVDFGALWLARRQAQNVADAGALAGAYARMFDDPTDPPSSTTSGTVFNSVMSAINGHVIFGVRPTPANIAIDWTCPDGSNDCVAVDVFRDGSHGSPRLPTFFQALANRNGQGTRAHAVARVSGANTTDCIRPWFMIDEYTDSNGDGHYNAGDVYNSPGYELPADLGRVVNFHNNLSPSGYGQVRLSAPGGAALADAIRHCAPSTSVTIGQDLSVEPGGTVGPNVHAVQDIVGWDSNAYFDGTKVVGSCAETGTCVCEPPGCPYGGRISPRIAIVPVCSPLEAACAAGGPSNSTIRVTNLLAFFVTGPATGNGNDMTIPAVLVGTAGMISSSPTPTPSGTFLFTISLIR